MTSNQTKNLTEEKAAPEKITPAKPNPARPEWREEVGHSGIYPMSAPFTKPDAPVRGQMEWGQGERGALGYLDHGASELSFEGGALLGGLDSEWAALFELPPPAAAPQVEIPFDCWAVFCDWFTAHHEGIRTTADVTQISEDLGEETAAAVRHAPLVRLAARVLENGVDAITIQLDRKPSDYLLNITQPKSITYCRKEDGTPDSLKITHQNGSVLLTFEQAP